MAQGGSVGGTQLAVNEDGERRNLLEPGAASAQQNLKLSVATGNILIQQNTVLPSV